MIFLTYSYYVIVALTFSEDIEESEVRALMFTEKDHEGGTTVVRGHNPASV